MIKVKILDFNPILIDEDLVNKELEAINEIGYIKNIKINTTKNRIIYTIIYEEMQMFPITRLKNED